MMMKKSRGRNAAKKDKLIDEEMADESRKSKIEVRSKVGDDMSKQDEANSTAQDNKLKKSTTDLSQKDGAKIQEGAKLDSDLAKLASSQAAEKSKAQAQSHASNESSYSDSLSQHSSMSERQIRLHRSKISSGLKRILHKLKKQKRQSRTIEKIFTSQKEKRSES